VSVLLFGASDADSSDEHPIYARSGWRIPQEKPDSLSIELMRIRAKERKSWRGRIILRSLSPYPYNCVGMIFASRRAWIEIDYIYKIFLEDGYRQISRDDVKQGDVILYKNYAGEPSHVALVVMVESIGQTRNIQVMSKWGPEAEYIHFMEDVPEWLGIPAEFYTERIDT
jgi:succinate dehydrogenase flavin-adding protein (antitoxin of CptAB toxin-antitoxin module)